MMWKVDRVGGWRLGWTRELARSTAASVHRRQLELKRGYDGREGGGRLKGGQEEGMWVVYALIVEKRER